MAGDIEENRRSKEVLECVVCMVELAMEDLVEPATSASSEARRELPFCS